MGAPGTPRARSTDASRVRAGAGRAEIPGVSGRERDCGRLLRRCERPDPGPTHPPGRAENEDRSVGHGRQGSVGPDRGNLVPKPRAGGFLVGENRARSLVFFLDTQTAFLLSWAKFLRSLSVEGRYSRLPVDASSGEGVVIQRGTESHAQSASLGAGGLSQHSGERRSTYHISHSA